MKLHQYVLSGAIAGYAVGCKMGKMRRCALRAMKRFKRAMERKLGL